MLGFWIYLMSDCLIFAVLFASYGVLGGSYAGRALGPKDLFELPLVALNTSMLLLSSITYGFAVLADAAGQGEGHADAGSPSPASSASAFLGIELYEFVAPDRRRRGARSAAPSCPSFFTLVGTHGLHVTFGMIWLVTLMVQVAARADRRQPAPPDVPVDVLALPRRRLDRRLHLRLSDGSAAMSTNAHAAHPFRLRRTQPRLARPRGARRPARLDHARLHDRLRAVGDPDGDPVLAGHVGRRSAAMSRRR